MIPIRRSVAVLSHLARTSVGALAAGSRAQNATGSLSANAVTTDEIPVLHRLAVIYLMLPVVIWLVGWFEWWLGIPAVVLLGLASWKALSGSWGVSFRPLGLVVLLLTAGWVLATAAGGVFDVHNPEWYKHRAIFFDLSRVPWPVYLPHWTPDLSAYLPTEPGQPGSLLRYYLGYYIVPGLLGRWFGLQALNVAVPLWTWGGASLILLMFTRGFAGWKALAAAVVFILFSGMDIVTVLLFEGWEWLTLRVDLAGWPQLWLGRILLERDLHEDIKVMFHSHMYGLMWVPQHFIPGALYALLLLQLRQHERFLAVSGIVMGAALFWSPFVAVGLLPFIAVWVFEKGIRPFLRWQNLFVALPMVALLVAYLSSSAEEIPSSWLWDIYSWRTIGRLLPVLYLTEFLLLAVLLALLRRRLWREPFFLASLATLLLLPLYYYGLHNDLVLRGLIPALVLLCCYCAHYILGNGEPSRESRRSSRHFVSSGLIVGVLVIGAVSPLFDLTRANNEHDFGVVRYAQLGPHFSILQIPWVSTAVHYQYIAPQVPGWFHGLLRDAVIEVEGPRARGEVLISSEYAVYHDKRRLVYVSDTCGPEEVATRFFLHVDPVDSQELPTGQSHFSYDFEFQGYGWRIAETCLAVVELPDYAIGHIKTGQLNAERTGHSWLGHYYSEDYRSRLLAEAGEPIIRSGFEVYLHRAGKEIGAGQTGRRQMLLSRDECRQGDTEGRFYVHVVPDDLNELSDERKNTGYDVVDFAFSDFGGMTGGACFAVVELPGYEIAEIRTGQIGAGGVRVWEGSYAIEK